MRQARARYADPGGSVIQESRAGRRLVWSLTSTRDVPDHLGASLTQDWADVSEWPRYAAETITDLRNLVRRLRFVRPPRFGAEDWVLLSGMR